MDKMKANSLNFSYVFNRTVDENRLVIEGSMYLRYQLKLRMVKCRGDVTLDLCETQPHVIMESGTSLCRRVTDPPP